VAAVRSRSLTVASQPSNGTHAEDAIGPGAQTGSVQGSLGLHMSPAPFDSRSPSSPRPEANPRGRRKRELIEQLPPMTDARRGERIQRVMADAGVAARRACERLVELGHVTVNGQTVTTLPLWVDPELDTIEVDGRAIQTKARHVYVMLNKPRRTLSTASDEPGALRRTVIEMVDHPAAPRLFPVGRLDYDTMGLILLTNDGDLANRLTHPTFGVPKTYHVVVRGSLDDAAIAEIERGIYLAERRQGQTVGASRTAGVELALLRRERDRTILQLTLREGRNRQVRRMLAAVGCPVKRLERVAMGPVRLSKLRRGEWRELTRDEIRALRYAVKRSKSDTTQPQDRASSPRPNPGAPSEPRPAPRVSSGSPPGPIRVRPPGTRPPRSRPKQQDPRSPSRPRSGARPGPRTGPRSVRPRGPGRPPRGRPPRS